MSTQTLNTSNAPINGNVAFNMYQQYSWINNALFYPLVPTYYYDYYNRFVRQYFYWYDGFNPDFHNENSGIFSSRIAYTICNKLAGLINGGTLMFDSPTKLSNKKVAYKDGKQVNALEFIEDWSYDVNLTNKMNTAIEYSLAGGDSVIKLNSDGTDVYPTVLRKDNYVVDLNFKGEVTGFSGVVYTYTKMTKLTKGEESQKQDFYYLLEERQFDDEGNPQYRIYVKVGYGTLTTNKDINFDSIQEVKWESLSKDVRKAIKDNYPNVKLGEWYDLPLKSLGIYLMKASDSISFLPQLPFGESILSNQIANIQTYDYLKSFVATELYLGRGRVLVPDPMQNPNKVANSSNHYEGLDSGIYNLIKYLKAEEQKPLAIQFEIRAEDITKIERLILRDMAMGLSISERTLANFLTDGSERATAREISVDDSTATFVENKRTLYRKPLNCMINDVNDFYNFDDKLVIRFSRVGLNNMNDVVQQMVTLKQNGLIDTKSALDMIYVDKNDYQIDEMIKAIKKEQEEVIKQSQVKPQGTSDEDYEQQNNTDINHTEKGEQ